MVRPSGSASCGVLCGLVAEHPGHPGTWGTQDTQGTQGTSGHLGCLLRPGDGCRGPAPSGGLWASQSADFYVLQTISHSWISPCHFKPCLAMLASFSGGGSRTSGGEAPTCHFDQLQEAVISGNSEHAQKLLDMVCQRAAQPTDSAKRDALAAIMEGQGVVTWDALSKKQKRVHKAPVSLQEELAQQGIEPPCRATVAQLQSLLKPKATAVGGQAKESGGSASVEKEIKKPASSVDRSSVCFV